MYDTIKVASDLINGQLEPFWGFKFKIGVNNTNIWGGLVPSIYVY